MGEIEYGYTGILIGVLFLIYGLAMMWIDRWYDKRLERKKKGENK